MRASRIIIVAVFAAIGIAVVIANPGKGTFGPLGWISLACMAIGAVVSVVEYFTDRAEQRREPAVREVPSSNGIQVLGTFLSDSEGGTDR